MVTSCRLVPNKSNETLAPLRPIHSFNASTVPTLPPCFNNMDMIFQLATVSLNYEKILLTFKVRVQNHLPALAFCSWDYGRLIYTATHRYVHHHDLDQHHLFHNLLIKLN